MASQNSLKRLQPGISYKEHSSRKRDSINKDRQWVILQRLGGIRRTSTLGWEKLDGISQGDAINKAALYKANFKWNKANTLERQKPICKADEIDLAKMEEEDIPTITELSERYLKHYVEKKLKPGTAKEYRRQLNKYIKPTLGKRRAIDIEKKHIIKLLEKISDSAPIMANRVLATIKGMFTYAVDIDILKISPASGIKPPGKEKEKERTLGLGEIVTMFNALADHNNRDTADIMRLITLTGLRPGEVAAMHRIQIKTEFNGVWLELKKANTKNSLRHRTSLNDQALKIINDRVSDLNLKDYLFPARTATGYMRRDVLVRRVTNIQPLMQELDIEPFTAHDLRRSAATGIAELGFWAIVPDILGHAPQGVTRKHYDHYSREPEIKEALEAWGSTIENCLDENSGNIIQIPTQNNQIQ